MSSGKKRKVKAYTPAIASKEATPWDVVNIFGYAIGAERTTLEYASRSNSAFNYAYCEQRSVLKMLRTTCLLRGVIIRNYDLMEQLYAERGKLCLPPDVVGAVSRTFRDKAATCKTPEDLFWAVQKRIERVLYKFEDEVPKWFNISGVLARQFCLDLKPGEQPLREWCERTADELGSTPYMYDHRKFSTRVLRDDRDLAEELCEVYGLDASNIYFPYSRSKSNRAAHTERLREFCEKHSSIVVEIDTENVEAAWAVAFLKQLEQEAVQHISHINVYLTGMESRAWRHISEFIASKVVYKEVPRIRAQKSSVDTAIIASIMESRFAGHSAGAVLISSDCDFLVLHQQMPDYPVCYCCARKQASANTLKYLRECRLPAVYIDYVVNDKMATAATKEFLSKHVITSLEANFPNIQNLIRAAANEVCIPGGYMPYRGDIEQLMSSMRLDINADGTVSATITDKGDK